MSCVAPVIQKLDPKVGRRRWSASVQRAPSAQENGCRRDSKPDTLVREAWGFIVQGVAEKPQQLAREATRTSVSEAMTVPFCFSERLNL